MIKQTTAAELTALADQAASADRLRTHLNIHDTLDANVQRLFIATEPATYIRPHRHPQAHKWEFFIVIRGEIHLLVFNDDGQLTQRIQMSPTATQAIEMPAGTWHSYVCMQSGTVALEIKEGPYIATANVDFAAWAPAEQSAEAGAYLEWMRGANEC